MNIKLCEYPEKFLRELAKISRQPEVLKAIAKISMSELGFSYQDSVSKLLIAKGEINDEIAEILLTSREEIIVEAVVENKNLSYGFLNNVMENLNLSIVIGVLNNPKVTATMIDKCFKFLDKEDEWEKFLISNLGCKSLLKNGIMTEEHRRILQEKGYEPIENILIDFKACSDKFIKTLVEHGELTASELQKIALIQVTREECSFDSEDAAEIVAENLYTDLDTLKFLYENGNSYIRWTIAERTDIPVEMLTEFAKEVDDISITGFLGNIQSTEAIIQKCIDFEKNSVSGRVNLDAFLNSPNITDRQKKEIKKIFDEKNKKEKKGFLKF